MGPLVTLDETEKDLAHVLAGGDLAFSLPLGDEDAPLGRSSYETQFHKSFAAFAASHRPANTPLLQKSTE